MGWVARIVDKLRKRLLRVGYTCDSCGGELFDYPARRLCAECEEKLTRVVAPCERCGRQKRAEGLCLDCKSAPPAFVKGISPFVYRGEAAMLVNRFKNGDARLGAYFGEKMGEKWIEVCPDVEEELLLLPVPTSKEGRRERGFNQAERLAEGVLDILLRAGVKAEIDFVLLEKRRETKPQKQMTRKEREENVRGAYSIADKTRCKDRTAVIIDDVMTTGATGNEIAVRLLKAGAKAVYFLTATSLPEQK